MNASALHKCMLWGLGAVAAYGQQTASCPLGGAKNGGMVVLRGEGFQQGMIRSFGLQVAKSASFSSMVMT